MVHTVSVPDQPDTTAPDGSRIDVLVTGERGSMARATVPPDAVTRPVRHRDVEELWYVAGGSGWLWHGDAVVALRRGVSVRLEPRVAFQVRAGHGGLEVVLATMPPRPAPTRPNRPTDPGGRPSDGGRVSSPPAWTKGRTWTNWTR